MIPNPDPSLFTSPAPYFQDNSFVRGDQMRANNQAIWGNFEQHDNEIANEISARIAADDVLQSNIQSVINNLPFRNYVKLTITGTWINPNPTNIKKVFARVVGGGGGGAGGSNTNINCGGGGASGCIVQGLLSVGASVGFTIGGGGAGGSPANVGGSGGISVFGLLTASGGFGGGHPLSITRGGDSDPTDSDPSHGFSVPGQNGTTVCGGHGGGHGGGPPGFTDGSGTNGTPGNPGKTNTGGGGGGGGGTSGSTGGGGGAGADGYIELWY